MAIETWISSLNSDSSNVGTIIAPTPYPKIIKEKNLLTLLEQGHVCCKPKLM